MNTLLLTVGFAGQTLFSARMIVQWLASEKNRQSVVPDSFWYLSLGGALILLSYALFRKDPVFVFGQLLGTVIYLRNLYFIHPHKIRKLSALVGLYLMGLMMLFYLSGELNWEQVRQMRDNNSNLDNYWQIFGFVGQFLFSSRFVIQWFVTEKNRKSTMPQAFWYMSAVGSTILLCYAIYQQDPVFIIGQSFGMFVYLRNLYFIFNGKN